MRTAGECTEGRTSSRRTLESLAACGLAIAMAITLHHVRLFRMPQGGSVTLGSALPIWIVAFRYGWREGVKAGFGTGVLLGVLSDWKIHPVQVILDYPAAWAVLGLAGLSSRPLLGAAATVVGRYAAHVVSGVVFFGSQAMPGMSLLEYSLLYNLSVVADLGLALALLALVGRRAPALLGQQGGPEVGR